MAEVSQSQSLEVKYRFEKLTMLAEEMTENELWEKTKNATMEAEKKKKIPPPQKNMKGKPG